MPSAFCPIATIRTWGFAPNLPHAVCTLIPCSSRRGISAKNVTYFWENGRVALEDVTVHVPPGELTMIVGENGCGKSTLLKNIAGMLQPAVGTVSADQPCAFVHQDPDIQILFPTVGWDIAASVPQTPEMTKGDVLRKVISAMEKVGLDTSEDFRSNSSFRLSGGQKQRVVIASALAMEPMSMLFDEATASLDPITKAELLCTVKEIIEEKEIAALWVTHLLDELEHADNILIMSQGSIVAQGPRVEMMPLVYDLADGVKRGQVTL
eukprot:GFKZ01011994.1.p1 GENE.GFKZ01011994.1~~GFKZ01011994.1.p1  ORF type:complete len:266 (-),score=25.83 GFKZ01011994.1:600-1397(-)